ncbi:MAG TPA: hypothetical protein VFA61_09270 [Candidatus Udaeobacter sp.]|nr:hypothetical protein [Candidatus Udaeobacter sp.]
MVATLVACLFIFDSSFTALMDAGTGRRVSTAPDRNAASFDPAQANRARLRRPCGRHRLAPVNVGTVSLVFALPLPAEPIQWSGWVYFSMIILVPLHDFFHEHRLKAVHQVISDW